MAPPINDIVNKEVRGITWRQLGWLVGALMTVECTLVGMWYSVSGRIVTTETNIIQLNNLINNQGDRINQLRVDVDLIKIHNSRTDAQLENLHDDIRK